MGICVGGVHCITSTVVSKGVSESWKKWRRISGKAINEINNA